VSAPDHDVGVSSGSPTDPGRNWAGSYTYRARRLHRPTTLEQLQEVVAGAASVHAIGSRHSFNGIADAAELVSLEAMPADVVVDPSARTVSLGAGLRYGDLVPRLDDAGLALHTLASLPHSLAQSADEQSRKSQGRGSANTMRASGRLHADDRIQHGFTFRSVLSEFRALRATVMRLYAATGSSDLTDVLRFNEAIDEALTESMDRFAGQTDQFRDQFIGVLSHDLRTPLGAITAGAALLALPDDNPQRRSWVVTRILNSAQRMERMIGDLLDVTRARLGGAIPLKRGVHILTYERVA
jgi:signal transduction histidine kinase